MTHHNGEWRHGWTMTAAAVVMVALVVAAGLPSSTPTAAAQSGWNLVWSDEFNGSSIDGSKWNVLDTPGGINNELHYISKDDVYVSNGNLVIRSQKRNLNGHQYTSGKITTGYGKYSFTYGRVDIRSKQPAGQGLHAANWLLHYQCGGATPCATWPPEIDLVEVLGAEPNKAHQNVHYGTCYRCRWPDNASSPKTATVSPSDYHIYRVEWEPGQIRWYIDGVQTHTWNGTLDEPMQIILDTAVGGDWPGTPQNDNIFPAYHLIDYVRVYQQSGSSSGTNLITNSGFESGVNGWNDWSGNPQAVNNNAHSGSAALRLGGNGGRGSNVSGWSAGQNYTFNAWGKYSGSADGCKVGIQGGGSQNFQYDLPVGSTNYTQYSKTFTLPAGTTWVQVYAWKNGGSGTCYVDDFSLK